jgi:RNA polymerase sigma-70 factor (ECF subfamily)
MGRDASMGVVSRHEGPDDESSRWVARLSSTGADRVHAIQALFELCYRGARHEIGRRRGSLPPEILGDLDDLAHQAADDAVAAIVRKLADYRGASRFTTWAYKFAVFEASSALRREAWRSRDVTIDDEAWGRVVDAADVDPAVEAQTRELVVAIERAARSGLTPWQREVFTAVTILEVPIDVLAARHGSTRGAIYKVLHDARRRVRTWLAAEGWQVESTRRTS